MADTDSTAAWHSVHRRAHGHGVPGRRGRAGRPTVVPAGYHGTPAGRRARGGPGLHQSHAGERTGGAGGRRGRPTASGAPGRGQQRPGVDAGRSGCPRPRGQPGRAGVADVFLTDLLAGQTLEQAAMACVETPAAECLRKRRPPDPSGEHPIARVIRTGEAALMSEVPASWREHWAGSPEEQDLWEQMPLSSVVIVPITSHRQTHGALTFGFGPSGRRYDPADLAALRDIGLRTALALDTARLFHDLEAEQHHRDEFLAMLAHELRNPLSAVTTGLAVLEHADPASRARLVEILSRQSRHLDRLLNDLLDVSGVRFGRLVLDRQRLDLRELARDALEVVRTARPAVGPAIELRTDPAPVTVVGDADRLQQT